MGDYFVPVENIGGVHPSHPRCFLHHRLIKALGSLKIYGALSS